LKTYTVCKKHIISTGHRIHGHPGKCANLHGHSYEFHFYITATVLDNLGMVVDFAYIKQTLCNWLDTNYDHRMLIWEKDPIAQEILAIDKSVVIVPYNPTVENMADYLLTVVAPKLITNPQVKIEKVMVGEGPTSIASCEMKK
jgi:6-pyruvoyltetrahydropterin/6-carboxytetrahydropterin synthase